MAQLTDPEWTGADGSRTVTTLPHTTRVSFSVTRGGHATGAQVTYRLHSARLRFRAASDHAALTDNETAATAPMPVPQRRDDRVIVDHYPNLAPQTAIVRALEIERVGPGNPAIASLRVTVSDLPEDPAGVMDSGLATLAFVLS
jgi:hypothetical protein